MFNLAENSKLRGIGYKLLNVLRACNIIALLAVAIASWVMIVMEGITGQFFFFDAMVHVFTSSAAFFLIFTEVQFGFVLRYIARSWPIFSCRDGFLWLGLAMLVLGCDILSCLNKSVFSSDNIGLPLYRLILASGILSLIFGVCNLIVTVIFRDGPARLTARMIRADGNLANGGSNSDMADYYTSRSNSFKSYAGKEDNSSAYPHAMNDAGFSGGGFGGLAANRIKRMTQAFKSPFVSNAPKKMQISAPIPAPEDSYDSNCGDSYPHTADSDVEHDGYRQQDRASPILPAVQRPPTALHPALNRPISSHYSEAHISRF